MTDRKPSEEAEFGNCIKCGSAMTDPFGPVCGECEAADLDSAPPMWAEEFDPSYKVPALIERMIPDVSWYNDACPSFSIFHPTDESPYDVTLWVEHPNPYERESGEISTRFAITGHGHDGYLWAGEDAEEAVRAYFRIASGAEVAL